MERFEPARGINSCSAPPGLIACRPCFHSEGSLRFKRLGPFRKRSPLPQNSKLKTQNPKLKTQHLIVVRFVSGLPLDVATDAGSLIRLNRLARKNSVDSRSQISTRQRPIVARTAVVQLTSVHQAALRIE